MIAPNLAAFDLTDSQRYEILNAHDEAPAGLARIIKRAAGANNPTAALISMVRKGAHTEAARLAVAPTQRFEPEPVVLADPEIRDHYVAEILTKLGRIGEMPKPQPVEEIATPTLAERLLMMATGNGDC